MTSDKSAPASGSIMVVGGGISGLTTAIEAAEVGRITSYNVCYTKLLRLGFLDLDDHLGLLEHRRGIAEDAGAGTLVIFIGHANAAAGRRFHEHLVTTSYNFV